MSLNIYSKSSVDALLLNKLGDAPSDGNQYVRKNATWSVLSGGGGGVWGTITGSITDQTDLIGYFGNYLPLSGGTLTGALNLSTAGVVYSDGSIQTTAPVSFTGGAITSSIYWNDGTVSTSMNDAYFLVQDSSSGAYGVLYQNGLEVGDGTRAIIIHAAGITFGDSSVQTTSCQNYGFYVIGSGDLSLDGYSLTNGNVNCSAGQATFQNVTLTPGDGGVLTFSDGSIMTTAPIGGSPDYNAISYLSFCVNLAFLFQFGSWNPSTPNQFPFNSGNLNSISNIALLNNIGVTQDGVNFYPFDSILVGGVTFQASTFTSFDSGNYIFLAFKDNAGTWHMAPCCILYSP